MLCPVVLFRTLGEGWDVVLKKYNSDCRSYRKAVSVDYTKVHMGGSPWVSGAQPTPGTVLCVAA